MVKVRVHGVIVTSPKLYTSVMDKYSRAIAEAEKYLRENQRDQAHDLQHHKDVWGNCQSILKSEKVKLHTDLLKVATFWHDVVVGEKKWPSHLMISDTCEYVKRILPDFGFSSDEINTIVHTILHHEFRDTPITVEGLVLQDADKLDAVSSGRWRRTIQDYRKGLVDKEMILSYSRTLLKWIPILSATFHFDVSRKIADKNIESMWSDNEWKKLVEEFELTQEYIAAKSAMTSLETKLKRMFIRCLNAVVKMKVLVTA